MADFLGLAQQQDQANRPTTTDLFGVKSPLSLAGQPALPQGGPAAAGTSSAPPTVSGAGVAPAATQGPGTQAGGAFGELAAGALPEGGGGSGAPGPGEGVGVGAGEFSSFSTEAGPFSLSGNPFGIQASVGPLGLNLGLGGISPNVHLSDNNAINTALNAAAKEGLNLNGLPSGVTASFLSNLAHAPEIANIFAGVITMMNPFQAIALVHDIAQMNPESVISLQNALNNPEAKITPQQALALVQGGARGPTVGGPQPIGQLPFDNPVSTLGQSPNLNTPEAQAQNLSQTPAFAQLAAALGFGREDIGIGPGVTGVPGTPTADPSGQVSGGELGIDSGGGPSGPGDASDGGSGAP